MLRRFSKPSALTRCFGDAHDPYWTHLTPQENKYSQYSHLHWHTVHPLEVHKHAQLRTKYSDHVQTDPASVDWYPEVGELSKVTYSSRNTIYSLYNKHSEDFIRFLEEAEDYEINPDHKLIYSAKQAVLGVLEPEQIRTMKDLAQKLVAEYQAAGVKYTREAVSEKVTSYMMDKLSNEQKHEIEHGMVPILTFYGLGLPMTED